MKALVKKEARRGVWLDDVALPRIGRSDVMVKITKTAICGTDLHIYRWDDWAQKTIRTPLTIGHEFCGEVVEIGEDVQSVRPGDRVSGEGHMTCGSCRNCRAGKRHLCRNTIGLGIHRAGAFAQYMSFPSVNIFKVDPSIDDDTASVFDPLGNATHTALSFDLTGEDVLVTGAGPTGLMATAIARHVGARHIVTTDVNPLRLELAKAMGASLAINPTITSLSQAMNKLDMREGFDVGLEMSGSSDAFGELLQAMNHGGKVALLGIFSAPVAIDWDLVIFKGLQLKGIYGREMFETWYKMASMLQSGLVIKQSITHRMGADEFEKGFELLDQGKAGKVVLDWSAFAV